MGNLKDNKLKLLALLFAMILITSSVVKNAAAQDRPSGLNCDLRKPPTSAGEEMNHGVTLRIHPRAKDISPAYSGCQVMFAPNGQGWAVTSLTEVVKGDPIRIWTDDPSNKEALNCLYQRGKVVRGNPDKCPAPAFLLAKSLASGCVKQLSAAVQKSGIEVKWPKGCGYE